MSKSHKLAKELIKGIQDKQAKELLLLLLLELRKCSEENGSITNEIDRILELF